MSSPLATRRLEPEWMDDPAIDPKELDRALCALARVHRVTGTARLLGAAIAREFGAGAAPLEIADLACGGGDLTIDLAQDLARRGLPARVTGYDMSPVAVARAREQLGRRGLNPRPGAKASEVSFQVRNLVDEGLPGQVDVFLATLFAHHLEEPALVEFLRQIGQAARRGCVLHDLNRSRGGYLLALIGTHALTKSWVARADGLLSIQAAFTPTEILALAQRAGLQTARVERRFPQRWQLIWQRPRPQ